MIQKRDKIGNLHFFKVNVTYADMVILQPKSKANAKTWMPQNRQKT